MTTIFTDTGEKLATREGRAVIEMLPQNGSREGRALAPFPTVWDLPSQSKYKMLLLFSSEYSLLALNIGWGCYWRSPAAPPRPPQHSDGAKRSSGTREQQTGNSMLQKILGFSPAHVAQLLVAQMAGSGFCPDRHGFVFYWPDLWKGNRMLSIFTPPLLPFPQMLRFWGCGNHCLQLLFG